MNTIDEPLQTLMQKVDKMVDDLLIKVQNQQQENDQLKKDNQHLKDLYTKTLTRIDCYIAELEQIKKSLCE